jgi:spermidine/putrescine transport system ATP-binding protein
MTMSQAAIDIRGVTKVFDADKRRPVTALDDVSLGVKDNEFFTLLGPSGCGKTTLLRLIAGFDYPTAGEIVLFGENIRNLPPQKRPVNTVFQHYALFPHMTVAENVEFPLKMVNRPAAEAARTVDQMLELVKMADFADRRPQQLSGGQQQRVALARALAPHPKVLLLDEPLSALDLKLRQEMRSELKTLQRQTGITFIFVTHDQVEALTMSDRIVVMSMGRVQQAGTPVQIYEEPVNRFVADFIGETNFIDSRVAEIDGEQALCGLGPAKIACYGAVAGRRPGESVHLAVRPEKIRIGPPDASGPGLLGRVVDCVYIGTDTNYLVALDHTDVTLTVRGRNPIGSEGRFGAGDAVSVFIADGAARVLAE